MMSALEAHSMKVQIATAVLIATLGLGSAFAQQVSKEQVDGVVNFARLETTVACGGSTAPAALKELKRMGFAAVFNLRTPTEQGNDVAAEAASASSVGMKFVNLPFDLGKADLAVGDEFLKEIVKPGNQPAYIHCAGGGRAAAMWYIKRVMVDGWDEEKAMKEAADLGLSNQRVKDYALSYVKNKKK